MAAMAEDASPAAGDPASARREYQGTRPGGRSARVRTSVLEAAASELTEHGYDAFSVPRVAERAGVALTTVHRRWGGKPGLIADVLAELTQAMVPDPQGSSLREDLRSLAQSVVEMLREPSTILLLRSAFALPDDALAEVRQEFWVSRFAVAQAIVDRAAERGEVAAGVDGWAVVEPVQALIWMRLLITGLPVDDAMIDAAVDRAVASARP